MAAELVGANTHAAASPAVDDEQPTTPMETATNPPLSESQQSLPSTEPPASPAELTQSLTSDKNNDAQSISAASIIPSSLTPPPSSQVPTNNGASRAAAASQRQRMLSPPITTLPPSRPDATPAGLYTAPRPEQVVAASPDQLRAMVQSCIAEQSRLKMEAAHHKLQYQLLSVRAEEDAHRAAVEQEMTLRQLDALRAQKTEAPRAPKREVSPEPQITQAMYDSAKDLGDKALKDNEKLRRDYDESCKRLKAAKKLIVRQEEEMDSLREENDLLRNRLLDKRELWKNLTSPSGFFHTPKTTQTSPAHYRQTPRQTPRHRGDRSRDHEAENFAVLLQAVTHENGSAPSTPITPRHPLKHHSRGVQSLSSLPSTPNNNARSRGSDLLPPPDLVPHTEPVRRFANRSFVPDTPERGGLSFGREREERHERGGGGRHSRESTISADGGNEHLARAALLQSVAQQATSFATRGSPPPRARVPLPSHRGGSQQRPPHYEEDAGPIYESQASQEASAMLRRDPRESFEVAASNNNSRDVTPTPVSAEKRLQSTLRGPVNKPGLTHPIKRKLDATEYREEALREPPSPTKRLRLAGGLREGNPLIGLGIRD